MSAPAFSVDWPALLADAVSRPGVIAEAYHRFWQYSFLNQLLAFMQCHERKISPGPINTFRKWKELGRSVRKGEKAITLCMPVTVKSRRKQQGKTAESADASSNPEEPPGVRTIFVYKPHWFVLSQTDGEPYRPVELPQWSEAQALGALDIRLVDFGFPDGNAQGYATGRMVAVSPVAFAPRRTLFHEIAHVVLRHTAEAERFEDGDEQTPHSLREVEAEGVAFICCESLGFDGSEFSRGYLQHWLKGQEIPERSVQRIFKAADAILKAGRPRDDRSNSSA